MNSYLIVSICMITYGHEKFIKQAIEGVLMQECDFEIELILANDCSPDKTDSIITEILKSHPKASKIKYFRHENNIGMMPNFIFAMKQCLGTYIALCEGDDYWTDSLKLQKQVDFLENNSNYVVCYHDCSVVDQFNNLKVPSFLGNSKKDYNEKDLKKGAWLPTLTRCFRNVIKEYPVFFDRVNCGDLFLTSFLGDYGKAKYLDFNGASYREHAGGAWSGVDESFKTKKLISDYIYLCKFYKNREIEVYKFYKNSLNKSFLKDFKADLRLRNIVYNFNEFKFYYCTFLLSTIIKKIKTIF
ncbi:glycosyltransferase family 2 protein [Flavobacterium sp. LPB0248]|uniref:glycosyltransferase family 2 protein n=1 Tax=Flavobacterium sp. LPB0248 TaxID=2614441 RepID=UPI0015A5CDAC|nr:glycosyltransferase family 2 protein [Flavobacterium sp. LPB0248]QLC67495.1 glycosyltransferase family 2 protein [Flavobacterium sp. LPB0248]